MREAGDTTACPFSAHFLERVTHWGCYLWDECNILYDVLIVDGGIHDRMKWLCRAWKPS